MRGSVIKGAFEFFNSFISRMNNYDSIFGYSSSFSLFYWSSFSMKVKLYLSTNLQYYFGKVNSGYGLWSNAGCALSYNSQMMYIFRSSPAFVIVIFATNCALRSYAIMFGLDMGIKSRVWKIGLVTCTTCKLPSFLITSRFSGFLLFYFGCF
jgi:hypothetical protein